MRDRSNEAAALSWLHGLSHCRWLAVVRLHQRFFVAKGARDSGLAERRYADRSRLPEKDAGMREKRPSLGGPRVNEPIRNGEGRINGAIRTETARLVAIEKR